MASRIFVTNLPPNLKENDFKKHFSTLAPVTDAKFIPKRRIGYVGYKTPELALKATKYYDRSFIRMSKIKVELARSVDEVQPRKKARIEQSRSGIEPSQAHDIQDSNDPKLQEFLKVMAPSSKSKIWANEDVLESNQPLPRMDIVEDEEMHASDDDYQILDKRKPDSHHSEASEELQSRISAQEGTADLILETTNVSGDALSTKSFREEDEFTPQATPDGTVQNVNVKSDSDWLRSKTSRLLGLLEDDELDARDTTATVQKSNEAESSIVAPKTSPIESVSRTQDRHEEKKEYEVDSAPDQAATQSSETGRLFLRNLSYDTTDADIEKLFSGYGLIEEAHVAKDTRTGSSKGFGYVQFTAHEMAASAKEALDGKAFQGRLLHIIPAEAKKDQALNEYEISKLPLKKQQEIRRKAEASTATFKWNSMYMNPDAILSSVASRLGVAKTDVLDPTSSEAAVKQAHAEINVITETKKYFAKHGVNLDAFKGKEHSDSSILVKNFPYGTTAEELKNMFEVYGTVQRMLMPPAATIAIVEMENSGQAKSAFSSLAYRKFKDTVLFLEKAPKALFTSEHADGKTAEKAQKASASDLLEEDEAVSSPLTTSTLFVRNLNFSTTSTELRDLFMPLNGFLSATVRTKTDPKKPGQVLSMGFGFVEFRSKDDALSAMSAMNGHKVAGHELLIRESNKAIDAGEERRKEDAAKKLAAQRTKIIIRNLPFEASKKDVRALFGPYGQLRTVRVPQKFGGGSRGFAFAEFVTTREAENAIKSLTGVHLLGRRLNLEYAAGDTLDAEEEIEKMSKKVSKQADKVAIQNLTSGGRKKFSAYHNEDDDVQ